MRRLEYVGALDTLVAQYRDSVDGLYRIDLCAVFNRNDWDSIVIIPAYTPLSVVRDSDFRDVSYVLPALEDVLYADWYTSVLFIRDRYVVGYSIVKGNPSLVYVTGYKDRAVMPVLARKDCRVRLRKTTQPGGVDFYFNPLKTPAADSILVHELNERRVVDSVSFDSLIGR